MKRNISILIIITLLLSSCATIFKGGLQELPIKSNPTGAKVYINGEYYGETPLKLELASNETYTIRLEKDGYTTESTIVNKKIGAGWVILDIVAGLVPVIVDAITGDWYRLEPREVEKTLTSN